MHRPFLAMALLQHPGNPFESTYSQSVLAVQNSASFIIQTAARYLDKAPESILRYWDLWAYLPNAAVSVHVPMSYVPGAQWTDVVSRFSVFPDHRGFDRDTCTEYAIER